MRRTNLGDGGVNGGRIDDGRFIACQAKKNGPIGGVALAGECKRPVERGLHARDAIEQALMGQILRKAAGSAHGAHGVRA